MINRIFAFVFAIMVSAQAAAALNNPFNKVSTVNIGSDIKWVVSKGVANKTSTASDKDGTFYQLRITKSEIILRLLDSAAGSTKSFDQLTIDDVQLDGATSTLFKWCLNNQQEHNRFLQQGLSVKKDICRNNGRDGVFVMKLNQATYDLLKTTQNLAFTIKPYRGAVIATFDVSTITDVFARLAAGDSAVAAQKPAVKPTDKFLTKPMAAIPVAKPKPVKTCSINPPAGFASLKALQYNCDDDVAKAKARKNMAASVKKARAQKEKLALEKKQKLKQSEAARLAREEEKRKEEEALAISEKKRNKIQSQVSERMVNMCKKKWAEGEHRCYCEPYLKFAPAGIKSDASCGGG